MSQDRIEFGFKRTVCDCKECSVFCRYFPGMLVPSDIPRIAEKLKAPVDFLTWAQDHFQASPGAVVMVDGGVFRIPTIVPAQKPNGHCIHLTVNGKCNIHAESPYGCSFVDSHQSDEEGDARSKAGLMAIVKDWHERGPYSTLFKSLVAAGKIVKESNIAARARMFKETGLV